MSKFIFVSGSYDPYPTANALCARAFEQALKKKGHEIIYVVTRHDITQSLTEIINGNRVFFIPKTIHEIHWSLSKLSDSFMSNAPEKVILNIIQIFVRIAFKLLAFFRGKSTREFAIANYRENFMKVMTMLLLTEKPESVLTFSVPFSSHLYTLDSFTKSGYRPIWFSFLIDAHKQKVGLNDKQVLSFEKEETIVFNNSDKCFFLDVLKNSYCKNEYKIFFEKFHFFHLPFLKIPLNINIENDNGIMKEKDSIDLIYAGTLYDNSSPINYFCSFIQQNKDTRIRFHLMGKFYPNNQKKILALVEEMPEQVFFYGMKSRGFVLSSLQRADMLINIGNNNANQVPSKILEYIGLQKPIISFVREENDASLVYLNRYPYSFVVDEHDNTPISTIIERVLDFYRSCKIEKIPLSVISKNFKGYLEEDVTSEIVNIIENKINGKKE